MGCILMDFIIVRFYKTPYLQGVFFYVPLKRKAPQSGEPDRGRLRRCLPALEGDMAGAAAVPWPYR